MSGPCDSGLSTTASLWIKSARRTTAVLPSPEECQAGFTQYHNCGPVRHQGLLRAYPPARPTNPGLGAVTPGAEIAGRPQCRRGVLHSRLSASAPLPGLVEHHLRVWIALGGRRPTPHKVKSSKDRYVPLPQRTLELLREYWVTHHHPVWLSPARAPLPCQPKYLFRHH